MRHRYLDIPRLKGPCFSPGGGKPLYDKWAFLTALSKNPNEHWITALHWVAAVSTLVLTVTVYWPGLGGPFLFDDFGTLAKLGNLGGVKDWTSLQAYVFSGTAGPTGRPLALLSFLLDANDWPAETWPFKRTNLAIHLINGALLYVLTTRLLLIHRPGHPDNRWLALASAAIWLLHPFLVSTTLYAVQRMAQLSTLFIFAGMLSHLQIRETLHKHPTRAQVAMGLSLASFTVLATLCKENGVLLPLLVGVLEWTLPVSRQPAASTRPGRVWRIAFLWLPATALLAYLGTHTLGGAWLEPNVTRGISVYERLITEFRILLDYQRHWFFPQAVTSGVFQDHVLPSRGLLDPLTTLLSGALHGLAIAGAIVLRRKHSLAAFSILFFYVSHLMESTVINLELYFEHRNYLAFAFLVVPAIALLRKHLQPPLFATIIVAIVLSLAGCTRYAAGIWSDYTSIVESAAARAPTSARAQQQYSQHLLNTGQADEALAVVNRALELMPNRDALLLHKAIAQCKLGQSSREDFAVFADKIGPLRYDPRNLQFHRTYVSLVTEGECPPITTVELRTLFERMLEVPINADPNNVAFNQISFFIGQMDLWLSRPEQALERFRASLKSRPEPRRAMFMAANLASFAYYDEARTIVDLAEQIIHERRDNVDADLRILEQDIAAFRRDLDDAVNAIETSEQ